MERKVAMAEKVPIFDNVPNVRGKEQRNDTIAVMNARATVQKGLPATVFKYSAPTRQCSACDIINHHLTY